MRNKFINKIFLILGTVILAIITSIVTVNFSEDSRLFGENAETVVVNNNTTSPQTPKNNSYPDIIEPETTSYSPKDISIELVSYIGNNKVVKDIKTKLESEGYKVRYSIAKTNEPVYTAMIERTSKGAGRYIQKLLQFGELTILDEPNADFDITIIIGTDFVVP